MNVDFIKTSVSKSLEQQIAPYGSAVERGRVFFVVTDKSRPVRENDVMKNGRDMPLVLNIMDKYDDGGGMRPASERIEFRVASFGEDKGRGSAPQWLVEEAAKFIQKKFK